MRSRAIARAPRSAFSSPPSNRPRSMPDKVHAPSIRNGPASRLYSEGRFVRASIGRGLRDRGVHGVGQRPARQARPGGNRGRCGRREASKEVRRSRRAVRRGGRREDRRRQELRLRRRGREKAGHHDVGLPAGQRFEAVHGNGDLHADRQRQDIAHHEGLSVPRPPRPRQAAPQHHDRGAAEPFFRAQRQHPRHDQRSARYRESRGGEDAELHPGTEASLLQHRLQRARRGDREGERREVPDLHAAARLHVRPA